MMKLHRFIASTADKGMLLAHDRLGPDALVFSTRRVSAGIEVIAGIPEVEFADGATVTSELSVENTPMSEILDSLILRLQEMDEKMSHLSQHMHTLAQEIAMERVTKKSWKTRILENLDRMQEMMIGVKYGKSVIR